MTIPFSYFAPQGVTDDQHTAFGIDWQGQELFYVIDKRQNGVKKITGMRIYLDKDDADRECAEVNRSTGPWHEVRSVVMPYQGDQTDASVEATIADLQSTPGQVAKMALEAIATLQALIHAKENP
jgi:hypothetical protein